MEDTKEMTKDKSAAESKTCEEEIYYYHVRFFYLPPLSVHVSPGMSGGIA